MSFGVRFLVFAAIAALGFAPSAHAASVFYTEQASVNVTALLPPTPPPITTVIQGGTSIGRVFTNTTASGNEGPAGSVQIRSVGAIPLASLEDANGDTFNGIVGPGVLPQQLVFAFAVQGFVQATGVDTFTAHFTVGRVGLFENTAQFFNTNNPALWDAPDLVTGERFNDPVISWTLKAPEPVTPGQGAAVFANENEVNRSAVNSLAGQAAQGMFLFEEDFDLNNFLTVTTSSLGPNEEFLSEGIFATLAQTLIVNFHYDQGTGDAAGMNELSAAQLAILNELAAFGGLSFFATGLGPASGPDGFNPGFVSDGQGGFINTTGDFAANLSSTNFYPGIQALQLVQDIPEPASLAIWGVIGVPFFVAALRRRRRKA